MHRVLFRSQLLPVKGACDYCQCCRALYGTQEGFLGCMHFFGEELSLCRCLLLPAGPHCPSCQEGFLGCMHLFVKEVSPCRCLLLSAGAHCSSCREPLQMLAAVCRYTLSLLPRISAGFETSWTCTSHHTHTIRAPPHTPLLLCTSYSCTQTYLHLTDAMLCNQMVGTYLGHVLAFCVKMSCILRRSSVFCQAQHTQMLYPRPLSQPMPTPVVSKFHA